MSRRLIDLKKARQNFPKADTRPNNSNENNNSGNTNFKRKATKIPRVTVRYDPKKIQQVKLKDDLIQRYEKFSEERNLGWDIDKIENLSDVIFEDHDKRKFIEAIIHENGGKIHHKTIIELWEITKDQLNLPSDSEEENKHLKH